MKREETSGITDTVWLATSKSLKFSPLGKNISVDVVIIGGGISGMTIAYMLANNGKKVAVVEDGWLGSGETGRTTAHISYQLDMDYSELIKIHGEEKAKIVAESHRQAIDTIESIVKKEGIDCDFERLDGYFSGNRKDLKNELNAMHSLGFHEVRPVNSPINSAKKSCLLFPWQAQFHVIKYIKGLANAIIKNKGQIFTGTHAEKIYENGIQTEKGFRINARHVVVATNAPVNENSLYMKQAAYRTYVLAALIPKNSVSRILLWDTEIRPYRYIRIKDYNESSDILIVGGEDHRTGQKNDGRKRYLALETFARKLFPTMKKIAFRWSGQVLESNDGLAFIGKNPGSEKIYIATGESGNGMTYSVIAGIIISDLIFGRKNPWEEIYNPGRKSVFMTKRFFQETVKTAEQYIDWLKIENVYPKLKNNEGTVLQAGLKKIAAYKDRRGKMHLHSAACPHRGCVVQWNDSEKSFDCPCHGSRFTAEGDVVNGPANKGLSKWKEENKDR